MKREYRAFSIFLLALSIASCTFNPFTTHNETTGNPAGAAIGALAAGGGVALVSSSKPLIAAMGLGGGMLGYYVTTLRYDSASIIQAGGQVYNIGDVVGIYIPTDELLVQRFLQFIASV